MRLFSITKDTQLKDLANAVGANAVGDILVANNLDRTPNIGKQYEDKIREITNPNNIDYIHDNQKMVDRKITILNGMTGDSDIFETACLSSDSDWQVISQLNTIPGYLFIPEYIENDIPNSVDTLGNGVPVPAKVYNSVMDSLKDSGEIDISVFNSYSSLNANGTGGLTIVRKVNGDFGANDVNTWFKLPFHEVILYSNLLDEYVEFPVYPKPLSDGVVARYDEMGSLLYQYEPWMLYNSSGPREVSFAFHMHRDMWTGDRKDGMANELIRFCESQCYPSYNGANVNTPTVTLYIHGSAFISGIMIDCKVEWGETDGALGDDGWFLEFTLNLTIREISKIPLNMETQRNKPLIG